MNISALLAGLFSGILGSMGLGGGAVLIIFLSVFKGVNQLKSQGINLLFFIPIAIFSVIFYTIKKQIKYKKIIFVVLGGISGVILGTFITKIISEALISKLFGGVLIVFGIKEVISAIKKHREK